MSKIEYKDLLDAGVHFGHLTRKWDPRMAPFIFMEKKRNPSDRPQQNPCLPRRSIRRSQADRKIRKESDVCRYQKAS